MDDADKGDTHQIRFTLTPEDYLGANRLHWIASYKRPRFYLTWSAVIAVYWIMAIVFGGSLKLHNVAAAGLIAVCAGLGVVLVCGLLNLLIMPRRVRRMFQQQKSLHQEQNVSIDPNGIRFEGTSFRVAHPWEDFPRWNENRRFMLLYIRDNAFHILPERALTPEVRAFVRQALAQAGVRKDR